MKFHLRKWVGKRNNTRKNKKKNHPGEGVYFGLGGILKKRKD